MRVETIASYQEREREKAFYVLREGIDSEVERYQSIYGVRICRALSLLASLAAFAVARVALAAALLRAVDRALAAALLRAVGRALAAALLRAVGRALAVGALAGIATAALAVCKGYCQEGLLTQCTSHPA